MRTKRGDALCGMIRFVLTGTDDTVGCRNVLIQIWTSGASAQDEQHIILLAISGQGEIGHTRKGLGNVAVGSTAIVHRIAATAEFYSTVKHKKTSNN